MSLGWQIQENEVMRGQPAVDVLPSDFSDNVSASYRSTFAENSYFWRNSQLNDANDQRIKTLEDHLGKPFNEAIKDLPEEEIKEFTRQSAEGGGEDAAYKLQNLLIDRLSVGIRDQGGQINIRNSQEVEAGVVDEAKRLGWKAAATQRGSSAFDKYVGGFVGGAAGALRDPINAASMFVGAGQAKLGARILQEAFIGAGVEAAQQFQPGFDEWKEAIGQEWGFEERISNILLAGAAAGGLTAGIGVGIRGARYARSRAFTELEGVLKKPSRFDNLRPEQKQAARDAADYAGVQARKSLVDEYSPSGRRQDAEAHVRALDEFEANARANRPGFSLSREEFDRGLRSKAGDYDHDQLNVARDALLDERPAQVAANDVFPTTRKKYFSFEEATEDFTPEAITRRNDQVLTDLQTRAETEPSATMLVDDRQVSVRQVLDEVTEQQRQIEAFRVCGLR